MDIGVIVTRELGDTYKLILPDGKVKTGLLLKEAVDIAEEALEDLRKAGGKHENDNNT